jgi:hypothetical protein
MNDFASETYREPQPGENPEKLEHRLFDAALPKLLELLRSLGPEAPLSTAQREGIRHLLALENPRYADFRQALPPATKTSVFANPELLRSLVDSTRAAGLKLVPAAGTSGTLLSFRVHQDSSETSQFSALSALVEKSWGLDPRQLLLLNAYPSGISLPQEFHSCECGAKPEVLRLALSSLGPHFEHSVLIAQPHFLRYCITEGVLRAEELRRLHFLLGGCWYSSEFLAWLAHASGESVEQIERRVISLLGVAEVGLGIGIAPPGLDKLRGLFRSRDPLGPRAAPMLFFVDTERYFVEAVDGKLLVTALSRANGIPLLRYATGDPATLHDPAAITALSGLPRASERPLLALGYRAPEGCQAPYAGDLEEFLDGEPELATLLTGMFRIEPREVVFEMRDAWGETDPGDGMSPALTHALERLRAAVGPEKRLRLVARLLQKGSPQLDLLRKPRPYA